MLQFLILFVDCFRTDRTLGVRYHTFLVETGWSNDNDETTTTRSLCALYCTYVSMYSVCVWYIMCCVFG